MLAYSLQDTAPAWPTSKAEKTPSSRNVAARCWCSNSEFCSRPGQTNWQERVRPKIRQLYLCRSEDALAWFLCVVFDETWGRCHSEYLYTMLDEISLTITWEYLCWFRFCFSRVSSLNTFRMAASTADIPPPPTPKAYLLINVWEVIVVTVHLRIFSPCDTLSLNKLSYNKSSPEHTGTFFTCPVNPCHLTPSLYSIIYNGTKNVH